MTLRRADQRVELAKNELVSGAGNTEIRLRKRQLRADQRAELMRTFTDLFRSVMAHPAAGALIALSINQMAYRMGLYDPRRGPDGSVGSWHTSWGVDSTGIHLGDRQWLVKTGPEADQYKEQIASQNATIIADMIIVASIFYAASPAKPNQGLTSLAGGK